MPVPGVPRVPRVPEMRERPARWVVGYPLHLSVVAVDDATPPNNITAHPSPERHAEVGLVARPGLSRTF